MDTTLLFIYQISNIYHVFMRQEYKEDERVISNVLFKFQYVQQTINSNINLIMQ